MCCVSRALLQAITGEDSPMLPIAAASAGGFTLVPCPAPLPPSLLVKLPILAVGTLWPDLSFVLCTCSPAGMTEKAPPSFPCTFFPSHGATRSVFRPQAALSPVLLRCFRFPQALPARTGERTRPLSASAPQSICCEPPSCFRYSWLRLCLFPCA